MARVLAMPGSTQARALLDNASLPSRLLLGWVIRLMARGGRNPLQLEDIPPTPGLLKFAPGEVTHWWSAERASPRKLGKPSLLHAVILPAVRGWFWPGIFLCFVSGLLGSVANPLMMQRVIRALDGILQI